MIYHNNEKTVCYSSNYNVKAVEISPWIWQNDLSGYENRESSWARRAWRWWCISPLTISLEEYPFNLPYTDRGGSFFRPSTKKLRVWICVFRGIVWYHFTDAHTFVLSKFFFLLKKSSLSWSKHIFLVTGGVEKLMHSAPQHWYWLRPHWWDLPVLG